MEICQLSSRKIQFRIYYFNKCNDMNGKEAKIQFDCVSGIEYNRNDFTQYFMKYYVVEKNKYFQKEYEQEMKLPENIGIKL